MKTRQRFLRSSLTLVARILQLLEAGNYPSKVARLLGMSRQHVHYYCRKLLDMGYVRKTVRDRVTFYELTAAGKNFLTRSERRAGPGVVLRLHGYALKYPVLEWPRIRVDWPKVQRMKNWNKMIGSELGLTVELTTRHLITYADVIEGDNPYELIYLASRECDRLAAYLESKFQMRLGRPKLKDPRPHFGVWDPIAQKFSEWLKLSDDIADIDRSPPYKLGEIDWRDPEAAKRYLITLMTLPSLVREFRDGMREFRQGATQHMAMIKEVRELARETRELVKTLEKRAKERP